MRHSMVKNVTGHTIEAFYMLLWYGLYDFMGIFL